MNPSYKRFFGKYLIVILMAVFGGFLLQGDAQAYFAEQNGTQCFAVQYKLYEKYNDQSKSADSGATSSQRTTARVYSTGRVCASVDGNGNITGNLKYVKNGQSGTTSVGENVSEASPNLVVNGTNVSLRACDGTGLSCASSMKALKQVDAKNGQNFKSLMKQLQDAAPSGTNVNSKATKMDFEDNMNTTDLQKKADEEDGLKPSTNNCKGAGGAKALGWVVCPILEWMGDAASNVYNDYVEPSLQIDPQLISGGNDSVRQAWGTFQNIANILFVILLLAVIFSQLTGVGIDNYGIKRILPKLIVAAVLINLSYVICLLLVDASNILGNSFQSLFKGLENALGEMPKEILIDADSSVTPDTINTSAITGLTGVGLLGAIVAGGAAIFANPAILLSLLVSALGIVIAVFFLFILLSAREAAIIVLIVISPIAVVLYTLPNTKKVFDKWWKLFEGLLLVYPICGLLVGAGGYISKLILIASAGTGGNDFIGAFTAMIISVVPVFFIPTVLKNSFAALGNLGSKIAGFGQRVSSGATSMARSSQAYKNAQELGLERRARIQAGIDSEGKAVKTGRLGSLMRGGDRSMARARAQYLKNQDMRDREKSLMGVGYDAAVIGQAKRAEADELANYMTLINDKTRNGEDEVELFKLFDKYMDDGNKAGVVAATRIAGRRKDTAARFADTKLTDASRLSSGGTGPSIGSRYNSKMAQSLAKEMATGENSANYRAAAPLAFEFASNVNNSIYDEASGTLKNQNGEQVSADYAAWAGDKKNLADALEHHVTNVQELVGMKGSSLDEIDSMIKSGQIDGEAAARIKTLATQAIENRSEAGAAWDSTKANQLAEISGQYTYDPRTDTLTRVGGSSGRDSRLNQGDGQTFDINDGTNVGGPYGTDSVSE